VLFALLPVLFLYSHNMHALLPAQLVAPLLIALSASAALWVLLALVVRERVRAALVSTLFWLWFFAFGPLHNLLTGGANADLAVPKTSIFVAIYWMILLVAAGVIISRGRRLGLASSLLNVMAVALVAWHALAIADHEAKRALTWRRLRPAGEVSLTEAARGLRPNIYYIILDGYARDDVLRDLYHYDNSEFLDFLRRKGFQVARRSKANFAQTVLSLASSLNFEYLDRVAAQVGRDAKDIAPLSRMAKDNRLVRFLRRQGYTIIGFSAEYEPIDPRSVDIYLDGVPALSEFQQAIVDSTPLALVLATRRPVNAQPHAQRVLYTLDHLADTAKFEPPYFVFAHVMCPHPPFVFDRDGHIMAEGLGARVMSVDRFPPGTRRCDYIDQVRVLNRKVTAAVARLMSSLRWPSVIIIQSDHGASSRTDWNSADRTDARERLGNLVACYLPGRGAPLDDDISAVNIFRVVLNRYFDANLPLLANEAYFSVWNHPYRFVRVTDRVDPPAQARR
jgi:hypothetical protein